MSLRDVAETALVRLEVVILVYFVVVNAIYLVLLVSAAWELRVQRLLERAESRWRLLSSDVVPSISLLAPAHNEAATIVESVRAMLGLEYPNLEVVVINDGSTDATVEVLRHRFDLAAVAPARDDSVPSAEITGLYRSRLHPNLLVVDKLNGGKADALNAGLKFASGDLVCAMDADTLVEPDALQRMVRPFLRHDGVVSAGGTIRVANGSVIRGGRVARARVPAGALAGFQAVEYLRAFLFGRLGWNRLGGNLIVSGAFGLFDRAAVVAARGYVHDTVGEDMELVMRLRMRGYEQRSPRLVVFVPDPVAWTEVPTTLRVLGRQRDRWHRGLADVLRRSRRAMLNPRYGAMGLVVFPYFVMVELIAPVVEAVGLAGVVAGLILGSINTSFAVLFLLLAYGLGVCLSLLTIVMDELAFHRYRTLGDRLRLLAWAVGENLGYRQLTVVWRLRGIVKYLRGRTEWGVMTRAGFGTAEPADAREPAEARPPGP